MKFTTLQVQAKDVPVDTFVYLPKKNLFLFVDKIEFSANKLEFIFELDTEQQIVYSFSYDELVSVVAEYSTELFLETTKYKKMTNKDIIEWWDSKGIVERVSLREKYGFSRRFLDVDDYRLIYNLEVKNN